VHLGSYGRDLTPRSSLLQLLVALSEHQVRLKADITSRDDQRVRLKADTTSRDDQQVRLKVDTTSRDDRRVRPNGDSTGDRSVRLQPDLLYRISSLEPMDCTPEIVDLVATSSSFAPHFHLPLQHASDRILTAMRRPYTAASYASLVDGIRSRIPAASIGSDVIVGFPGETAEDFEALAAYLERSPLTHLHVFPYSDRPGTAAAALTSKVHGAAIRERARRIREIGARLTARFRDSQIGTMHRALTIEDGTLAVTGNYLKLRIPPGRVRNEWIRVKVASAGGELTAQEF
jgi:tRNA A37 methylthiotransferase MiaB